MLTPFSWNRGNLSFERAVSFDDETLRDGLQSPSVTDPPIEEKIQLLALMEEMGIQTANIGLPGAGPRAVADVTRLCEEIAQNKWKIVPNCAGRTINADIDPIAEITKKTGVPILACLFLGCSQIRQYTESWDIDKLLSLTAKAVTYGVERGLEVMFVTEDTTRAHPQVAAKLYMEAIRCGATRICIADTVGHSTPWGAYNLVKHIRQLVGDSVKIDWHGHNDRAMALENSIAAYLAGADRLHGTALGIGERCGNTSMELLLLNFEEMGGLPTGMDLTRLPEYVELTAKTCQVPISNALYQSPVWQK